MAMQVQTHLGATGIINNKYLAWKKKAAAERKWAPANKYLRVAIRDVKDLNKLTTSEAGLTSKVVSANKTTEQQVIKEMAENSEILLTPWQWRPRQKTTPSRS